jgi:hypothetical protein
LTGYATIPQGWEWDTREGREEVYRAAKDAAREGTREYLLEMDIARGVARSTARHPTKMLDQYGEYWTDFILDRIWEEIGALEAEGDWK